MEKVPGSIHGNGKGVLEDCHRDKVVVVVLLFQFFAGIMPRLCGNCAHYAEIMRELCKNYAEIMRKLCGNYVHYAEIKR